MHSLGYYMEAVHKQHPDDNRNGMGQNRVDGSLHKCPLYRECHKEKPVLCDKLEQ